MHLSRSERWILSNQFAILAHVDPENRTTHLRHRDVVLGGYELEYEQIFPWTDADALSSEACMEVLETIQMFGALQRSSRSLGGDAPDLTFVGYDFLTESEYLGYAQYYCSSANGDQFSEVSMDLERVARTPMRDTYRTMLDVWKRSADPDHLTPAELSGVLASCKTSHGKVTPC